MGRFARIIAACCVWLWLGAQAADKPPVLIGLDAEFGVADSLSGQAVEQGLRIAMAQINAAGGVLGGRPLQLEVRDHAGLPARGIRNLREFANLPDLVAVFGARFSPVIIEEMPVIKETQTLFMATWSSADPIVENGMEPNYVFRLSLFDKIIMARMMQEAADLRAYRVGLLLSNTGWGRSAQAAAESWAAAHPEVKIVHATWANRRDTTMAPQYRALLDAGAQVVVAVINDDLGAILIRELAALPRDQRRTVLSHWGVTGGDFAKQAGPALNKVDFRIIQSFSFFRAKSDVARGFFATARTLYGWNAPDDIAAPVGVAHAFDLMHILARAIDLAGSTDRAQVRDALERVRDYHGLVKFYERPFAPRRHEALDASDILMTRIRDDGVIVPLEDRRQAGRQK
ncbi:MAG: ABC transporter substrate-binding protein [Rhodocyclaceae bacterium]|nr:ABC transporter substrate-binding protein [Rhodocyclaceae bacterium]MBX3669948.1 ABC transporter substrate-binding protein [Rhodocyclaceae bacterium]